jgi:hypothetical protein
MIGNIVAGTFSVLGVPISVECLVIAGGAGGGSTLQGQIAGGGGAGGYKTSSENLSTAINYVLTVGAGGAADSNGQNSIFASIPRMARFIFASLYVVGLLS